jgi:phage gpG-like protein
MQVVVEVTGLDPAKANLTALGDSLHDFTDALTTLGETLILYFGQTVFVSQGEALGDPWAALAPSTVAEKEKKYPGRGTLVRTGELQNSFYDDVTPLSLFVSNNAKTPGGQSLFEIHQLGTSGGRGRGHNIPARHMIGVNASVVSMIETVIKADIDAKIASVYG